MKRTNHCSMLSNVLTGESKQFRFRIEDTTNVKKVNEVINSIKNLECKRNEFIVISLPSHTQDEFVVEKK